MNTRIDAKSDHDTDSKQTESATAAPDAHAREFTRHPIDAFARALPVLATRSAEEGEKAFALQLSHLNSLARPSWLMSTVGIKAFGAVRLCPMCLSSDKPQWQASWQDAMPPWCEAHRVWLVDSCDSCQRMLRWNRIGWQNCCCGQALRELPAVPVPVALWALTRGGLAQPGTLLWLGALSRFGPSAKPLKKTQRRQVAEVANLLELGAELVAGWPATFDTALTVHRVPPQQAGCAQLLNDAFPGLNRMLKRIPEPQWAKSVKSALAAYVLRSRSSDTPLVGRNESIAGATTSVTSVASMLKVRSETVAALLDEGVATERGRRITQSGRARRILAEGDIAALARALNDPIGAKPAARILGLAVPRVRQLAQDGLIRESSGTYSRSELDALLKSVNDVASEMPAVASDLMTLGDALRFRVPVDSTTALVLALQSKELVSYRVEAELNIASLRVSRHDIDRWTARGACTTKLLTIPQAAQKLSEKQQVIYDLVNAGLLQTVPEAVRGRQVRKLCVLALAEFRENYIALAELALRAGVPAKAAYSWALEGGVEIVSGPALDGRRKYFARRCWRAALGNP